MLIPHQKITPNCWDTVVGLFESKDNLSYLRKYIPCKNLTWIGSGRAALKHILSSNNIKKVGLPSFTCHVVLDSIQKAGCSPFFIDSGAIASYQNLKQKISRLDALVLPYNFGFLPELDKISRLCKKHKVILIEDCAQALGATYNNKLAGSFGYYAFYSSGISKNIGFLGGMIGTEKEFALPRLKNYPSLKLLKTTLEAVISPLFFNKHIYPFTYKLLQQELSLKQEELNYSMPIFARNVVLQMFKRYDQILQTRRENAKLCLEELKGVVDFIKPLKNTTPAWLYFVLLSKNKDKLRKALWKEKVDVQPLLTYKDLSGKGKLAKEIETNHLVFALYRNKKETEYIIRKIKKVCKDGDY